MTKLLQQAFNRASKLPTKRQDQLARRLLAELAEDAFDQKIAKTSGRLLGMAKAALAEHQAGKTMKLDPQKL